MKRAMLALLVVSMVIGGAAAAFAADSVDQVVRWFKPGGGYDVNGALPGSLQVTDASYLATMDPEVRRAVNLALQTYKYPGLGLEMAKVSFIPGFAALSITVGDRQLILNIPKNVFEFLLRVGYSAEGEEEGELNAMATSLVPLTSDYYAFDSTDYYYQRMYYLSMKYIDGTGGGSGGGGSSGCSALTLGAVALFLLPAFAAVKRGKK